MSWGALIALAAIGALSGPWWTTAARLATEPPRTATAKVEQLYDDEPLPLEPWLVPSEAKASFTTADGRRVVTDIVVTDPVPAEGDTLAIEYAERSPSAVRVIGDPDLTRGLWLSGIAAALVLGRAALCALGTGRTLRRVLRAARRHATRPGSR
ncbi:hypothetical protein RGF97_09550 [Streptomyces roseicoloratus]|uniref:DUF3592 domain-containing protein n=1 Tax=Streptomyces roseicoloratus TaxID=2508722 RepID=A0ABY9RU92_9ACTN|nr:hypothetical protein [Streptomyces roseicoloratus]WMX45046.1 hypothetical protein RGF97_09550 [Streptomyces roseicoloratus]